MRPLELMTRRLWWVLTVLLLLLCSPGILFGDSGVPPEEGLLRVSVLDIGQGDAIVIQAPNGRAILIDAGPAERSDLLLAQLKQLHIRQFDLVIVSHPHEDHIGGLSRVLDTFKVRYYTDAGTTHTTDTYARTMNALKTHAVETRVARAGQIYKLDDEVFVDILGPRDPLIEKGDKPDLNENSVVARLKYRGFSMLLPGDGESEAEERLMEVPLEPITVLKVAHHGSHSSSSPALLRRLKPELAIISCETGNDYGHPHAVTMETLKRRDVTVYRTDRQGQVRLLSDGHQLWVKTFPRSTIEEGSFEPSSVSAPFPLPQDGIFASRDLEPSENSARSTRIEETTAPETFDQASAASTSEDSGQTAMTAPYVASKNSKVFHKASCRNAKRIKESNLRYYDTREEAISVKRPAKCCHP